MAFDAAHRRTVLFGGGRGSPLSVMLADTWEYAPASPAAYVLFGAGCPGFAGIPSLTPNGSSLPWLGDTFTARLDNLGGNPFLNVPFLTLGDSRATWGSFSLPLDLSFLGMLGCTAYTNSIANYPLANVGGTATWSVQIPNDPTLAGTSFYTQAGVTAPGANPFGVAMSNACELKIGAK